MRDPQATPKPVTLNGSKHWFQQHRCGVYNLGILCCGPVHLGQVRKCNRFAVSALHHIMFFWGETRLEKRLTDIRKSRHKLSGSRFGISHCHSTYFFGIKFASGYTIGQRQGIYHNATAWWLVGNFRWARLEPNRKNVCAWVCLCVEILNISKTSIVASFSAFRFQQGAHGHLDGMGQRRPIQVALQTCMQSFHSDGMWPTEELPCRFSTRISFYRRFYFSDLN